MPQYAALTFTRDVDWTAARARRRDGRLEPSSASAAMVVIRGGAALYPTAHAPPRSG